MYWMKPHQIAIIALTGAVAGVWVGQGYTPSEALEAAEEAPRAFVECFEDNSCLAFDPDHGYAIIPPPLVENYDFWRS